jgi:hypothetical protein
MKNEDKKTKKPSPKKLPKIPPGANVKIIEISLSKLILPLLGILLLGSILWTWSQASSEKVTINEKI